MVKSFASVNNHNLWDFMNRKNNRSLNLKPSCLIFVYLRYKEERFFDKLHIVIEWNQDMGNSNNGSKCKYYVI